MKKTVWVLSAAVAATVLFSGCTTPIYTKRVAVEKDGQGNVIKITEIEEISEPHSETKRILSSEEKLQFNHLR